MEQETVKSGADKRDDTVSARSNWRTPKVIPENVQAKWGDAAKNGYQAVPHALFKFQKELGLSNGELVTLLNILDFWWEAERRPWPGATVLAKRMGVDVRSVQRNLKKLDLMGYAKRERRGNSSMQYNLTGLVATLNSVVANNEAENLSRRLVDQGAGNNSSAKAEQEGQTA